MAVGLSTRKPFARRAALVCLLFAAALVVGLACSAMLDLQACEDQGDCPDNLICTSDGLCGEPDGEQCTGDADCEGSDEVCSGANRCEVMPAQCMDDDVCPTGFRCTMSNYCRAAPEECEEHEDCFEGYLCGVNDRCIDASAQCELDSDCESLFGESASCDDGLCTGETELLGGPCQRLYGAAGEEEAILFGVVLQLSGTGGGFGQPMLDAIRIATRDINNLGGIDSRKIGLIACDTEASNTVAEEAADHLVNTAGVEAIIGFNSSQVISVGQSITVPNEVLLMSPSATAQSITYLSDDDLIWRTAPSDEHQAAALIGLVEHVLDDYLPAQEIAEPNISILVRRQDQWADELFDELIAELPGVLVSDEERFSDYRFANVGAGEPADYTDVAAEIASQDHHPDVVVVLGSADSWEVISHIDNVLPGEPLFIGADAMKNLEEAAEASSELEGRIWGTGPRTAAELDYQPYTIFRLKFEQELNANADTFQFVANAFDALYTLAFASAAALSGEDDGGVCDDVNPCAAGQNCVNSECVADRSISGPNLARGLTRLNEGNEIRPTSSDASQAINTLLSGGTVNYAGASGPINFDSFGDPEPMPIALWCFEDGQVPERGELYTPDGQFTPLTCVDSQ